jgi:hypothetical protein
MKGCSALRGRFIPSNPAPSARYLCRNSGLEHPSSAGAALVPADNRCRSCGAYLDRWMQLQGCRAYGAQLWRRVCSNDPLGVTLIRPTLNAPGRRPALQLLGSRAQDAIEARGRLPTNPKAFNSDKLRAGARLRQITSRHSTPNIQSEGVFRR